MVASLRPVARMIHTSMPAEGQRGSISRDPCWETKLTSAYSSQEPQLVWHFGPLLPHSLAHPDGAATCQEAVSHPGPRKAAGSAQGLDRAQHSDSSPPPQNPTLSGGGPQCPTPTTPGGASPLRPCWAAEGPGHHQRPPTTPGGALRPRPLHPPNLLILHALPNAC